MFRINLERGRDAHYSSHESNKYFRDRGLSYVVPNLPIQLVDRVVNERETLFYSLCKCSGRISCCTVPWLHFMTSQVLVEGLCLWAVIYSTSNRNKNDL